MSINLWVLLIQTDRDRETETERRDRDRETETERVCMRVSVFVCIYLCMLTEILIFLFSVQSPFFLYFLPKNHFSTFENCVSFLKNQYLVFFGDEYATQISVIKPISCSDIATSRPSPHPGPHSCRVCRLPGVRCPVNIKISRG